MPLPDLNVFCVKLTPANALCVQMPGGAMICATFPSNTIPVLDELSRSLLGHLNTALAPLMPIFDILDVLVCIVNCIKAIEKCLGPPPNPAELIKCFPALASAMAKVLRLLPQLSIPILIGGILDVLITNLMGTRTRILCYLAKQARIAGAQAYVAKLGSRQLQTAIDCASEDLAAAIANLNADITATGQLVLLVNLLLGLAGLPELPLDMSQLDTGAEAALIPLDLSIEVLTTVRRGFP